MESLKWRNEWVREGNSSSSKPASERPFARIQSRAFADQFPQFCKIQNSKPAILHKKGRENSHRHSCHKNEEHHYPQLLPSKIQHRMTMGPSHHRSYHPWREGGQALCEGQNVIIWRGSSKSDSWDVLYEWRKAIRATRRRETHRCIRRPINPSQFGYVTSRRKGSSVQLSRNKQATGLFIQHEILLTLLILLLLQNEMPYTSAPQNVVEIAQGHNRMPRSETVGCKGIQRYTEWKDIGFSSLTRLPQNILIIVQLRSSEAVSSRCFAVGIIIWICKTGLGLKCECCETAHKTPS